MEAPKGPRRVQSSEELAEQLAVKRAIEQAPPALRVLLLKLMQSAGDCENALQEIRAAMTRVSEMSSVLLRGMPRIACPAGHVTIAQSAHLSLEERPCPVKDCKLLALPHTELVARASHSAPPDPTTTEPTT
jgi:hypothetical protein